MDRERAEEQIAMIRDYNEALREERDTLRAEAARLREALKWQREAMDTGYFRSKERHYCQECAASALEVASVRHAEECPLGNIESALTSTPTAAEWLAARDAEMRRIGAAEWLEKEAADFYERFGTNWYGSTTDSMLAEAARLRAGKGEK